MVILIPRKRIRITNHDVRSLHGTRLWFRHVHETSASFYLLLPQPKESGACQAQGLATVSKHARLNTSTHSFFTEMKGVTLITRPQSQTLTLGILWQDNWSACQDNDEPREPIIGLAD